MVKFSHSLQFNTVPDWANEYIAYTNLKKTLYAIEKYNVQNAIEGETATPPTRPSDLEQGQGGSSSSEKRSGFRRFIGKKEIKKSAVTAAAQEAALHDESEIFPVESAAFEQELAKELAKITAFYIRKDRELAAELDAVDRQWQLEELKLAPQQDHVDMERRKSINIFDEKRLNKQEKTQLSNMMGWERDGLQDRDGADSHDGALHPPSHGGAQTANGSTIGDGSIHEGQGNSTNPGTAIAISEAEGSEYLPRSHGRMSSVGDLTEIVWRRENLIESDDDDSAKDKTRKTSVSSGTVHPMDGPLEAGPSDYSQQYQHQPDQQQQQSSQYLQEPSPTPGTRHQSLVNLKEPRVESSLRRSKSHVGHARRFSMDPRRSFSAVRDIVTGGGTITRENPNLRPSAYAPLTTEALLRRRLIDTYMLLSELKSYVALNYLGFQKIVKKHDKLAHTNTLGKYMSTVVDQSPPFKIESRQNLDSQILRLQAIYARTCTNGSMSLAAKELRAHLREYIVWERNTVWRDMVQQERKAEGARAVDPKEQEPWMVCGHAIHFMNAADFRRLILGIIGCGIFALLMCVSIFDTREQNRCFAILITVAYFWATEVFPLFATAFLVPLLAILCQVMRDPTTKATLSTTAATKVVFGYMFSPTIMLLLGGFTIASALSKFGIAKAIASAVLSKAGTDPKWVLLANMFVATLASMFISNVAAPVLCFSLIQSILRNLPHKSTFGPCLIMGIALAANVGGMASPISSPQNIITIQNMTPAPSWGNWFAVSIPLCVIIDLIIWAWLILLWRPQRDTPTIPAMRATKEPMTFQKVFISLVTIGTIVLWCIENTFQAQLGDMGVIAILPVVAFFGTGLLTKEDFNNFLWTVIVLAMGGIALGKAVDSSGLLDTIAHHIQSAVSGFSMWVVLLIFSFLTLVFATFVSHTVAAVIILPIIQQVGMSFADPHPRVLVMGAGLVCSAAMGLPVSGYPNMLAIAQVDDMGMHYLSTMDFVKSGVPLSVLATLCCITIGYGIMLAMGF
ncbi:SPX-domain-containing protein [Linnemannia elongata AG-77]|uniref:SPX-domain-containing protein n=1 Tax=Linnemannia elongata AG-77 TaxID=1314771 RepID=A0A197JSX6_9FUNG|nr:SPX-domain-containing protein [Linnemannia elongata AG-77]